MGARRLWASYDVGGRHVFRTNNDPCIYSSHRFIVMSLVRWLSANKPESSQSSALDILRERFAKGEIDKEEYEERRKILGNDP